MLAFVGILLVLAAVLGGDVAEKGNPYVLLPPAELLIVYGSAIGIVLIAHRPPLIRKMARRGIAAIFFPPRPNEQPVLRSLRMLYEVFSYAQRAGVMALESHVEELQNSSFFSRYPELLRDRTTLRFLCDSWRMLVIGATTLWNSIT